MDVFITQAFTFSKKSQATVKTYRQWTGKLCEFVKKPHPLDVTVDDIRRFYVFLHDEKYYSRPSLEIVRASIQYFYCALCRTETPEAFRAPLELSDGVKKLFTGRRSYKHGLPVVATQEEMATFLHALPDTNAGYAIRQIYACACPVRVTLQSFSPMRVSRQYLQHVAAHTARGVGILHNFGLRGVRASGIVHRLQAAGNDYGRVQIFQESGLSTQQFKKYEMLAGRKP